MMWSGYYDRSNWHPGKHTIVRNNLIEQVPGDGVVPLVYRQWKFVNELSFHYLRIKHLFPRPVAHQHPLFDKSIQFIERPLLVMSC